MKPIAVVILNWNGKDLLAKYLPSVLTNSPSELVDVIVADNGSTDDSLHYIKNTFPSITCIEMPTNLGFAEGYNRALYDLDYKYFLLLNSDVEVTPGWIEPLYNLLENDNSIAAAQPKILSFRDQHTFEHAGASGGFIDYLGYPYCRGRLFTAMEIDEGQYDDPIDCFWASGCALFIRSCDFAISGGFDGSFFAHMEEIDLCWRLNRMGRRIVCEPQSTIYHLGAATLHKENPRKAFLNFRNNLLMLYKNLPVEIRTKILIKRFFLDILVALKMAITGEFASSRMVIKAIMEFYSIRSEYDEKIKINNRQAIISTPKTILQKSIVKAFYLKGVKKSSNL